MMERHLLKHQTQSGYRMPVTLAEGHKTSLASFWTSTQKGHLTTVVLIIATSTSVNSKLFLLNFYNCELMDLPNSP